MDPRLFRLFGAKPQAPHDDFGGGGSGGDGGHDAARGDDDAGGDEGVPGDGARRSDATRAFVVGMFMTAFRTNALNIRALLAGGRPFPHQR